MVSMKLLAKINQELIEVEYLLKLSEYFLTLLRHL